MSDLQDALDGIRGRVAPEFMDGHQDSASPEVTLARLRRSQADVPRLLAAVEAVLELHCENAMGECHYCMSLVDAEEVFEVIEWPCDTVRALTDKLTGEGDDHP